MKNLIPSIVIAACLISSAGFAQFKSTTKGIVPQDTMEKIYNEIKTPFKYGWVIKWKGVVYHFYTAVGKQGRVIALATSKDLTK